MCPLKYLPGIYRIILLPFKFCLSFILYQMHEDAIVAMTLILYDAGKNYATQNRKLSHQKQNIRHIAKFSFWLLH